MEQVFSSSSEQIADVVQPITTTNASLEKEAIYKNLMKARSELDSYLMKLEESEDSDVEKFYTDVLAYIRDYVKIPEKKEPNLELSQEASLEKEKVIEKKSALRQIIDKWAKELGQ